MLVIGPGVHSRKGVSTYERDDGAHLGKVSEYGTLFIVLRTLSLTYVWIDHPWIRTLMFHFVSRHYHHYYIYQRKPPPVRKRFPDDYLLYHHVIIVI